MALFSLLSLSLWRIKSAPLITIKCFLKKQSASEGTWPWAHYNLPCTNAFLGTINFLQYTPKFSVFKLKRCKRVPHHIAFLSSSMFWGGKKFWGFKKNNKNLLLLEKGMYVRMTPLKFHHVIKPFIGAAGLIHYLKMVSKLPWQYYASFIPLVSIKEKAWKGPKITISAAHCLTFHQYLLLNSDTPSNSW